MPIRNIISEYAIHGDCSFFACRYCRTKYGWEHQAWCEMNFLTAPTCFDCQYYRRRAGSCKHPALKNRKEDMPREENKRPLRAGQNARQH